MKLVAVTGLYDIGRATQGDGRSIDDYIGWLNRTLRLPVPFIVFLDPTIDAVRLQLKPGDELRQLPWSELIATRWLPQVEDICRDRSRFKASEDLVYRLPKYSLVNFSKLDMLERVAGTRPDASYLLWVDAGASRFSAHDMAALRLRTDMVDRLMSRSDFAINARHHLRDYSEGRPAPVFPGRCQPLTTGGVFMVRREAAGTLRKVVFDHVEHDWLPNRLWDTEQTALGEVILAGKLNAVVQDEAGYWISLLAALFESTERLPLGHRWEMPPDLRNGPWPDRLFWLARSRLLATYRRHKYHGEPGNIAVRFAARDQ